MFQKINKIGAPLRAPLHPAEELYYLLNGIKEENDEIKMGKITTKTYRIGMAVELEAAVVHLYNCLPEVRSTCEISSAETGLGGQG